MRKSRFTEAQIIGMIKEQEAGMPTAELCRKHGLNRPGFTGGQNSRRIAHYGTDTKEEDREAVFT